MFLDFTEEENCLELEHWLPVAQAKASGFKFLLSDDGDAEVLSPDGKMFVVNGFNCKCKNHIYRNHCFHALWVGQLRPCEQCGSVMQLVEHTTCFSDVMRFFECSSCGNARDLDLVREERRLGQRDGRLTPDGRCNQAIAWLRVKDSDWYVWQLVKESPELVGTMVIALSEIGKDMLADKIIQDAGFKAA